MRTPRVVGIAMIVAAAAIAIHGTVQAATLSVEVQDFQFSGATINVNAGDTVQWEFVGASEHNVTAVDGAFSSGNRLDGTFDHVFSAAGTFNYYCTLHGDAQGNGMAGSVVVTGAATPTNTAQSSATASRTPTRTPEATGTPPAASATPLSGTTPPAAAPTAEFEADPISAPAAGSPGGGAQAGVAVPNTGSGPDGSSSWRALAAVLAAAGVTSFGAASLIAKRHA